MRWAIFVHDPDGDMGWGTVVGPFSSVDAAERKADSIRRTASRRHEDRVIEAIIVPVAPQGVAARDIVTSVLEG